MGNVPAIPESTRSSIMLRTLLHAKEHWPQLGKLEVTCRGGFAYTAAILPADNKPQPLFRLRYGGSAHSFGFAVYSSATGRYENSVLLTGRHTGTPQEALDTVRPPPAGIVRTGRFQPVLDGRRAAPLRGRCFRPQLPQTGHRACSSCVTSPLVVALSQAISARPARRDARPIRRARRSLLTSGRC